MNAKVFINYRREDTAPYAGRLYDRLIAHFGEDQVFIDIDQIEPGEDFVEAINRKVSTCDIAIVAIGLSWLRATDASGKRRLDDEEDFVRMEIVAALRRKILVIPVLVGGARMPGRHDLPEALAPLSRRNAIELERSISVSSNPGDVVLDPFCGCGTTIHAQKLNRQWIGIDITYLAINLIKRRLKDAFGEEIEFEEGQPTDFVSAKRLAEVDKFQFQHWALSFIGAHRLASFVPQRTQIDANSAKVEHPLRRGRQRN
jgi:hypothetical protein